MTTRAAVVAEALTWLGTPFHDCARVKGAGTDCLNLLIGVFSGVGMIEPFDPPPYSPQWFEHKDEPRFLLGLEAHARRVEVGQPGDIAMYRYGRHAAHSAIIIDERTIIHAFKAVGRVTKGSYLDMLPRLDSLWSVFP